MTCKSEISEGCKEGWHVALVIKEFVTSISVIISSSWFKQIPVKDDSFFALGVLQLRVQHASLRFPRPGDTVTIRRGGQFT